MKNLIAPIGFGVIITLLMISNYNLSVENKNLKFNLKAEVDLFDSLHVYTNKSINQTERMLVKYDSLINLKK